MIGLLVSANGCMTKTAQHHADGTYRSSFTDAQGKTKPGDKPNPAYYALMPLTIPADIVTSPFQLGAYLWFIAGAAKGAH